MAEIGEISDALRRYMLPHLDLQHIVRLASSSRAWHELTGHAIVDQLSNSVRRTLLPSGLTSDLPLQELVEYQTELLARLRCNHGFSPRIQPLSLSNDLSSQQGILACEPPLRFEQLVWSRCTRYKVASHWLLLHARQDDAINSILLNAQTGQQQVHFQQMCLSVKLGGIFKCKMHASWLADQPCLLCHPAFEQVCDPREIRLADASTGHVSAITLPGAQHEGSSQLFEAHDNKGCAKNILAWVAAPAVSKHFEDHIIVYDVSGSWQHLYQLSCPDSVVERFRQLHGKPISPDSNSSQGMQDKDLMITAQKLMLSPDGKLLAIAWLARAHQHLREIVDEVKGLSIHSALKGECKLSLVLMPGHNLPGWDDPPSWLPNSSNLMYANSNGLHVISSTGQLLWSQHTPERTTELAMTLAKYRFTADGECCIYTRTSVSECGRWICVADEHHENVPRADLLDGLQHFGQASIVEAASGLVLHRHKICADPGYGIPWSKFGATCLIPGLGVLPVVLSGYTSRYAASQFFRPNQLLGGNGEPPCLCVFSFAQVSPSLSPCGSIVIGCDKNQDANGSRLGLQQWRLPAGSAFRGSAPLRVKPETIPGPIPPGDQAAWHPLPRACIYATGSTQGGVQLIDARANRCIKSWSETELHGPAAMHCDGSHPYNASANGLHQTESGGAYPTDIQQLMEWSKDGRMLAVASHRSGPIKARCRCAAFLRPVHYIFEANDAARM